MMIFYPGWYLKEGPLWVFLGSRIYLFWRGRWCKIREWKYERDASGLQVRGKIWDNGIDEPSSKAILLIYIVWISQGKGVLAVVFSHCLWCHRWILLFDSVLYRQQQGMRLPVLSPSYQLVDIIIIALSPKEAMSYFGRPSFLKNTSLGRKPLD